MSKRIRTKWIISLMLAALLASLGCPDSGSTGSNNQYAGNWSGEFSGDDTGMWSFMVESDGEVVGSYFSFEAGEGFDVSGTASNDGDLVAGSAGEATWTGQFRDGTLSGTWENAPYSGEFTGTLLP